MYIIIDTYIHCICISEQCTATELLWTKPTELLWTKPTELLWTKAHQEDLTEPREGSVVYLGWAWGPGAGR